MKHRIIALLVVSMTCAVVLAGCSSGGQASSVSGASTSSSSAATVEATTAAEPKDLELVDSNYVISNGYVMYTLAIENPNSDFMAEFANVTVTGKTADGKISFSDEWVVGGIMPGTTTYWASQAGDGDSTEGDQIEISVSVNKSNWEKSNAEIPADLYKFENISVEPKEYGGLKATGELTLSTEDVDFGLQRVESPMIVCVLKDADGKIVAGFNGFIDSELTAGKASVFEISSYYDVPDYASAELYANPW